MYGIVDKRYGSGEVAGLLRGKSFTIEKAIEKSRHMTKKLNAYDPEFLISDLEIVKLNGKVLLGKTVTIDQVTHIPIGGENGK